MLTLACIVSLHDQSTLTVRVTSTSTVQPTPGLRLDIVCDTLSKYNVHDPNHNWLHVRMIHQ